MTTWDNFEQLLRIIQHELYGKSGDAGPHGKLSAITAPYTSHLTGACMISATDYGHSGHRNSHMRIRNCHKNTSPAMALTHCLVCGRSREFLMSHQGQSLLRARLSSIFSKDQKEETGPPNIVGAGITSNG